MKLIFSFVFFVFLVTQAVAQETYPVGINAESFLAPLEEIVEGELAIYRNDAAKLEEFLRREGTYALEDLRHHIYAKKVDSVLNTMYNSILVENKKDTTFIRAFKEAQRAWVKFRDAQLASIMPPRPHWEYGSVEYLCRDMYFALVTRRRIEELMPWYKGVDEGDVFCGTYKVIPKD